MKVQAIKTKKVVPEDDLYKILDEYLPILKEKDIVVITSKIVAITQGNVIKNDGNVDKRKLIIDEADLYIDSVSDYGIVIPTIKNNVFLANSGVDESNSNGYFVLWPRDLEKTTNSIWKYLRIKNKINNLGIVVTDSRLTPLTFGITGVALSWCGFEAFQDYRGKLDIFGRELKMSQKNIINGIAGAAELEMGEGAEQTPLGILDDVVNIVFQNRPPSKKEIDAIKIDIENDIYGDLLKSGDWKKGKI